MRPPSWAFESNARPAPGFFALPAVPVVAVRRELLPNRITRVLRADLACGHSVTRAIVARKRPASPLSAGDRAGCVLCWCARVGLRLHEGAGPVIAEGAAHD